MTSSLPLSPVPAAPPANATAAVSARHLVKNYGKDETAVAALRDVSIDVEQGRFTAIMGPSGSGKSTLMHLLAGLDTADSGTIHLGATEITGLNDTQLTTLRRDTVGFVFQAFNLVPTLTAEQNILLPIELAGGKPDLEWFDFIVGVLGLQDRLKHRPHELSGGQQQRVAVARALLTRPQVLFGDEPTGNLDSRSGAEVLSLMRRSTKELGQTIIMVTHDPVAASYADRVVLMSDGQIVGQIEEPTAESILAAMSELGA
ncbi:ABC transporter ATP-binding protein [Arthrobacter sp. NPDC090010]|uniref:ABC transporter ATP-binding protein n=1 Tax=Arthrobacter sp. NPDC090010 TaxID=3363942 RepID=UPI0037FBB628